MITTVVGSYPVVKKEETFLDKVKRYLACMMNINMP